MSDRKSLTARMSGAVATLILLGIAALAWVFAMVTMDGPEARDGGPDTVVILPSGSGVAAIGARLEEAGVIRSRSLFRLVVQATGADRTLRAGEYRVVSGASLADVVALLRSGEVVRHFVTLPEGWSSAQAVDILNRQGILTGTITAVPAEGSLLPETYEVTRGESRQSVIDRMQAAHDTLMAELWPTRAADLPYSTMEEVLTLASIVEKETGIASERPRVAAVFVNRLRAGMRLESDPTIIYGITQGRPLRRGIRRSELQAVTPYNTYQIDGLPPTPIANPGREAIEAVLNPPDSDELFFVADGTGGHQFARTYAEHQANVARWRALEAAAAGEAAQAAVAPSVPEPAQ